MQTQNTIHMVQIYCGPPRRRSRQGLPRGQHVDCENGRLCWIKMTMNKMCQHKHKRPDCKHQEVAVINLRLIGN